MTDLDTSRLLLEAVPRENAADLWRVMQAPDLREFQDVPRFTRAEFVKRVGARPRQFDARAIGRFEWLVRLRASRTAIGWVSLRQGDHPRGVAELGYTLIVEQRGHGYAMEAVTALLAFAFATPGIAIIEACCLPQNMRSRHLLDHLGFTYERIQRNGALIRGRPADISIFRLSRRTAPQASSANSIVMAASAKPK